MISIVTVAKRVLGGTKCLHHVISLCYSQINNKKRHKLYLWRLVLDFTTVKSDEQT